MSVQLEILMAMREGIDEGFECFEKAHCGMVLVEISEIFLREMWLLRYTVMSC